MSRKSRLLVIPPQHLGHELHVSRSIVCDMLSRGFIEPGLGDSVVTGLPDRKFFYQALFGTERVFDFSELPGIASPIRPPKVFSEYLNIGSDFFTNTSYFNNFDIINLTEYAFPPTYCTYIANSEMKAIGYEVPDRYYDKKFKEISQKFEFSAEHEVFEIAPASVDMFVIIHHRYGSPIDHLLKLISKFPPDLPKFIFTGNPTNISADLHAVGNIVVIDSLQVYATLLHDPRCRLLISEWSGGGQIAQYTLGPQGMIWYYYHHYPDLYNFTMTHQIWELNATLGTYFNCWDFKRTSGCHIRHFPDFNSILSAG